MHALSLKPTLTSTPVQHDLTPHQRKGASHHVSHPLHLANHHTQTKQLYISEVVLGTAFGVLMGPHCANIFDPRSWGDRTQEITLEVMRIVLATGLFAIGVELPQSYLADHAKGLLVMVVPTMAFGWVVVAGASCTYLYSRAICSSSTACSTRTSTSVTPRG